jgi:hypothetical protein
MRFCQKLGALARRFFGKKSRTLSVAQLELLFNGLAQSAWNPRRRGTASLALVTMSLDASASPDNLDVLREVIEPELVQVQPDRSTACAFIARTMRGCVLRRVENRETACERLLQIGRVGHS